MDWQSGLDYETAQVVQEIINADPSQAKAILAKYPQAQERVREVFRTNNNLRALFPEYIESMVE
jgi:hypothetical protein